MKKEGEIGQGEDREGEISTRSQNSINAMYMHVAATCCRILCILNEQTKRQTLTQ